jgi:hypothetical protein
MQKEIYGCKDQAEQPHPDNRGEAPPPAQGEGSKHWKQGEEN